MSYRVRGAVDTDEGALGDVAANKRLGWTEVRQIAIIDPTESWLVPWFAEYLLPHPTDCLVVFDSAGHAALTAYWVCLKHDSASSGSPAQTNSLALHSSQAAAHKASHTDGVRFPTRISSRQRLSAGVWNPLCGCVLTLPHLLNSGYKHRPPIPASFAA